MLLFMDSKCANITTVLYTNNIYYSLSAEEAQSRAVHGLLGDR